jgi:hypothetical protein
MSRSDEVLRRILLGLGFSWLFSVTLGVLAMICGFGWEVFRLPIVIPTAIAASSLVSILFAPLAVWTAKTGARNICIYGPILWLILAGQVVDEVTRHIDLTISLLVTSVIGLVVLGLIPPGK